MGAEILFEKGDCDGNLEGKLSDLEKEVDTQQVERR